MSLSRWWRALENIRSQAEEKGLNIEAVLPEGLPAVRASARRLNLLNNAVKFTPATGEVRLEAEQEDHLRVVVRDTGVGIDPEELPRIFEEFYHGKRRLEEGVPAGAGLAIAKKIVEAHGGKIWAESPGLHIMAVGWEEVVPEIVARAKLLPRPII